MVHDVFSILSLAPANISKSIKRVIGGRKKWELDDVQRFITCFLIANIKIMNF
jgi:hypothetical protein